MYPLKLFSFLNQRRRYFRSRVWFHLTIDIILKLGEDRVYGGWDSFAMVFFMAQTSVHHTPFVRNTIDGASKEGVDDKVVV